MRPLASCVPTAVKIKGTVVAGLCTNCPSSGRLQGVSPRCKLILQLKNLPARIEARPVQCLPSHSVTQASAPRQGPPLLCVCAASFLGVYACLDEQPQLFSTPLTPIVSCCELPLQKWVAANEAAEIPAEAFISYSG